MERVLKNNAPAVLAVLWWLAAAGHACAQPESSFRQFTTRQGLSHNTVTCITQDQAGFIWIGTQDGLNRHSGYSVDVFKHDPSDTLTISHSYIRCLFEDADGNLWVGTDDGLNRFDRSRESFERFSHRAGDTNSINSNQVACITQDSEGLLWIGTNKGLNRFDFARRKWTTVGKDPGHNQLSSQLVTALVSDQHVLWIGTGGGGLNKLDIRSGSITFFMHDPGKSGSISENDITCLLDGDTDLWIGTINEGLCRLDKRKGTFETFKNGAGNSISNNSVFSLAHAAGNAIWVGTLGGGLNHLHLQTRKFRLFQKDPARPYTITDNVIWCLYRDRAGSLWCGTESGINLLDNMLRRITTLSPPGKTGNTSVYCFLEDRDGDLWMGLLGGGLIVKSPRTGTVKHYSALAQNRLSLSNDNVFALCEDPDGIIWAGTYDGLNAIDKAKGMTRIYRNDPEDPRSISNNYVRALLCDETGALWAGTYGGGLNRMNRASGEFDRFRKSDSGQGSLSSDVVTSLAGSGGTIWIGTYGGGLCHYDNGGMTCYMNDPTDHSSLSNNFVNCLATDNTGQLWVGTYGGGLNVIEKNSERFYRFTERNGLPNNVVNGIITDNEGILWLSTNKGICRFTPASGETTSALQLRSYDARDGAQDKYNEGAFMKSRGGKLYFGGADGYNALLPEQITDNPYLPPVVITRFYLFEKPHRMDTMITSKQRVVLKHYQNFFSFEFAALNYLFPEKNQYAYMMEGVDRDWNYSGSRRYAAYTNIDPGSYTFFIKASNNDGIWNESGTALQITILPPFWKTWWFTILVSLALALAILMYIRIRTRALTRQNVLLENTVSQRTSELQDKNHELSDALANLKNAQQQLVQNEKMASLGRLTAGIAHEIKNPLNFVNNFSSVSADMIKDLDEKTSREEYMEFLETIKQNLDKISHHGKRADSIIQSMLLHTRTGELHKEPADINKLVDDVIHLAVTSFRANESSFICDIRTDYARDLPKVPVIPQEISRVVLNIIDNALFATQSRWKNEGEEFRPALEVHTRKSSGHAEIVIRDNGAGIPADQVGQLFEPFFTTKPAGIGTGLGLSMSYDMVKAHGGNITVKSSPREHTEFIISLPLS